MTPASAAKDFVARFALSEDIYAVLDGDMKCLFSSKPDLFPRGLDILPRLNETVAPPIKECRSVGIFLRGELHCAEIIPQGGKLTGRLYVCRITDYRSTLEAFSKTDGIFCISPAFKSLEKGMDSVLENSEELRRTAEDNLWYDMIVRLYRIESTVRNMYAESCNMFRYFTEKQGDAAVVDAVYLVGSLVERCNLFLAKCGREVRFLCDSESMDIAVNARHAVEALVNAVQNALLYSPRDCEPTVHMSCTERDTLRYMRLSISNESSVSFGSESSSRLGLNFGHRSMSYGIPIIREFVRSAGGSLNISEAGGRYCLTLEIPLYRSGGILPENAPRRIELGEYPDILFCGSRLDPVRLKMEQVIAAFGDMQQ